MSGPDAASLDAFLVFAHHLADRSGATILPYFRNPGRVEDKAGGGGLDPVTAADRAAEAVIRAEVESRWPEHAIEGEEFGATGGNAEYRWIVDPIDGTRSFIMGSPLWGTLIGLMRAGAPLLGLMDQPFTGERFWSGADCAFWRGPGGEAAIRARACARLGDAFLTTTHPDMFAGAEDRARFSALSHEVRMHWFGGDCYAYCLLAAGHIDIVVESGLDRHDIAPLIPIVERAGGRVTDWAGGDASGGGRVVACGDPALHSAVLDILSG